MHSPTEGTAPLSVRDLVTEFLMFGFKQVQSCAFAGTFFAVLWGSQFFHLDWLARYDFIFIAAVIIQVLLVVSGRETRDEVKVIAVFHILGLALELYKTSPQVNSWSYPEPCVLKMGTVPLYTGFMYAAVGSYMCQAWRILRLELRDRPPIYATVPLCAVIYINFFTHHMSLPDLRWLLVATVFIVYRRTQVDFTAWRERRHMPLALSFVLIGFFVWVAENIATYLGAWVYPNQRHGWTLVAFGKISSWTLLAIVAFIIVSDLRQLKTKAHRS